MTTELIIRHTYTAETPIRFWVDGVAYYANRGMYNGEFQLVVGAIAEGLLGFAD